MNVLKPVWSLRGHCPQDVTTHRFCCSETGKIVRFHIWSIKMSLSYFNPRSKFTYTLLLLNLTCQSWSNNNDCIHLDLSKLWILAICSLIVELFQHFFCNIVRNFRIYPSILPLWSFRDQHRVECIIWYWNTVAEWMGDTMQWIAGHASNNVGSCWIQPAIHNGNWNLVHPWSRPQLNSML